MDKDNIDKVLVEVTAIVDGIKVESVKELTKEVLEALRERLAYIEGYKIPRLLFQEELDENGDVVTSDNSYNDVSLDWLLVTSLSGSQ